jgi:hypothetical protein
MRYNLSNSLNVDSRWPMLALQPSCIACLLGTAHAWSERRVAEITRHCIGAKGALS